MKHVTYGDKSLFIDDATANLLVGYTVDLAESGDTDTVDVNAVSSDGNKVVVSFILNANSPLITETATGELTDFENEAALDYLRRQLGRRNHRPVPIKGEKRIP